MGKRVLLALIAVSVVLGTCCSSSYSQDAAGEDWYFVLTPYFWAPGIDGDINVLGNTQEFDVGFSDIFDKLNFGLMGRLEAKKPRWGFIFDGMYLDLEDEITTPVATIEPSVEMTMADFAFSYLVYGPPVGSRPDPATDGSVSFEIYGGGRYWKMELEMESNVGLAVGDEDDWWEPFIGARMVYRFSDRWYLNLWGDLGGGDIDNVDATTWNIVAALGVQMSDLVSIDFGYRFFDIDVEAGTAAGPLDLDATMSGPIVGLTFTW
jgi:hypothetical protein